VLGLLREQFTDILIKTWKPFAKKLSKKEISENIQEVSILIPETSEVFLDKVIEYLDDTSTYVTIETDAVIKKSISKRDRRQPEISDITDTEIDTLIDDGYLPETDKDFIKIWLVNQPEIAYLTYVTPRGNLEAELRYRQTLRKENYLKAYEKAGARKGDVLKVQSWYMGQEDKYILWD
jgi:hypothetical protein